MFNWLVVWNIFVFFPYVGNNHPNWLSYFFRGVETTNQLMFSHILGPTQVITTPSATTFLDEFLCRQAGALSLCAWLGRWPRDLDIGVLNRSLMWYENQHTDDGRRHPTPPWMAETLEIMNGMFTIYQGISQPSTVSTPKSSLCCKGISGWDFMETDTSRNKTSFSFDCGSRLSIRTLCGWWCKVPYFMIIYRLSQRHSNLENSGW